MRLLKEAQKGNPVAFEDLLEPYVAGLWSIAHGFLGDEARAINTVVGFRDRLRAELASVATDRAFGLQVYELLWRHLSADVEPSVTRGIRVTVRPGRPPRPESSEDSALIREVLGKVSAYSRLVYLFWLVTDLDAPRLAKMMDEPELRVRLARSEVMVRVREAMYS